MKADARKPRSYTGESVDAVVFRTGKASCLKHLQERDLASTSEMALHNYG